MRTEFNESVLQEIQSVTGLDGGPLYILTGVALATAILGKVPVKKDLAYYLGVTERELDRLSKTAVDLLWVSPTFQDWNDGGLSDQPGAVKAQNIYYALATDLITEGCYCDAEPESPEHCVVRRFMGMLFNPSEIHTRALFAGYRICSEYLTGFARGFDCNVRDFLQMRYGKNTNIPRYLQVFCNFIGDIDWSFRTSEGCSDYLYVMHGMVQELDLFIENDVTEH